MSLDPALLDPQMSKYFFGQPSHDPPPYSEIGTRESHVDEYSQQMLIDHPESSWIAEYSHPFDAYIAQPFPDPFLLPDPVEHSTGILNSGPPIITREQSISISPSMLNKSASISVQDDVVWYSCGKELQVGGKNPPRTKYGGEGKGKGKVLEERRKTIHTEDLTEKNLTSEANTTQKIQGTRYEMNVETGLDTIKRIKLIFHEYLPSSMETFRPGSSGSVCGTRDNPVDVDSAPRWKPNQEKRDIVRRDEIRVAPLTAMDPGCPLLAASELHLDDNTPPPTPSVVSVEYGVEVMIPLSKIDKSSYPVYLGSKARQTMVRRKSDGSIKGLKFVW